MYTAIVVVVAVTAVMGAIGLLHDSLKAASKP